MMEVAVAAGREHAFHSLFEAHHAELARLAYLVTGDVRGPSHAPMTAPAPASSSPAAVQRPGPASRTPSGTHPPRPPASPSVNRTST